MPTDPPAAVVRRPSSEVVVATPSPVEEHPTSSPPRSEQVKREESSHPSPTPPSSPPHVATPLAQAVLPHIQAPTPSPASAPSLTPVLYPTLPVERIGGVPIGQAASNPPVTVVAREESLVIPPAQGRLPPEVVNAIRRAESQVGFPPPIHEYVPGGGGGPIAVNVNLRNVEVAPIPPHVPIPPQLANVIREALGGRRVITAPSPPSPLRPGEVNVGELNLVTPGGRQQVAEVERKVMDVLSRYGVPSSAAQEVASAIAQQYVADPWTVTYGTILNALSNVVPPASLYAAANDVAAALGIGTFAAQPPPPRPRTTAANQNAREQPSTQGNVLATQGATQGTQGTQSIQGTQGGVEGRPGIRFGFNQHIFREGAVQTPIQAPQGAVGGQPDVSALSWPARQLYYALLREFEAEGMPISEAEQNAYRVASNYDKLIKSRQGAGQGTGSQAAQGVATATQGATQNPLLAAATFTGTVTVSTPSVIQLSPDRLQQYLALVHEFESEGMNPMQAQQLALEELGVRGPPQVVQASITAPTVNVNNIDPTIRERLTNYFSQALANGPVASARLSSDALNYLRSLYMQVYEDLANGDYAGAYIIINTIRTVVNSNPEFAALASSVGINLSSGLPTNPNFHTPLSSVLPYSIAYALSQIDFNAFKQAVFNQAFSQALTAATKDFENQLSSAIASGDYNKVQALADAYLSYLNTLYNEAVEAGDRQIVDTIQNIINQVKSNASSYVAYATINAYVNATLNTPDAMSKEAYLNGLIQYLTHLKATDPNTYNAINGDNLLNQAKVNFIGVVYQTVVMNINNADKALKNNDYDSAAYYLTMAQGLLTGLQGQYPNEFKKLGLDKLLNDVNFSIGYVTALGTINNDLNKINNDAANGDVKAVSADINALKQYFENLKQTDPTLYNALDNALPGGVNGFINSTIINAYGTIYNNLVNTYNSIVSLPLLNNQQYSALTRVLEGGGLSPMQVQQFAAEALGGGGGASIGDPYQAYYAGLAVASFAHELKQTDPTAYSLLNSQTGGVLDYWVSVYETVNSGKVTAVSSNIDTSMLKSWLDLKNFVNSVNEVMASQHISDPEVAEAMLLNAMGTVSLSANMLLNAETQYALNPNDPRTLAWLQSAASSYYNALLRLHELLPNDPDIASALNKAQSYLATITAINAIEPLVTNANLILSDSNPTYAEFAKLVDQYNSTHDPSLIPEIQYYAEQLLSQLTNAGVTPQAIESARLAASAQGVDPETSRMINEDAAALFEAYNALLTLAAGQNVNVAIPAASKKLITSEMLDKLYGKYASETYNFLMSIPEPLRSLLGFTYGMGEWINSLTLTLAYYLGLPGAYAISALGGGVETLGGILGSQGIYNVGLTMSRMPNLLNEYLLKIPGKYMQQVNVAFSYTTPSVTIPAVKPLVGLMNFLGIQYTPIRDADGKLVGIKLDPVSAGTAFAVVTFLVAPAIADVLRGLGGLTRLIADPGDLIAGLQRIGAPDTLVNAVARLTKFATDPGNQIFLYNFAKWLASSSDAIRILDFSTPIMDELFEVGSRIITGIADRLPKFDATAIADEVLSKAPPTAGFKANIPLALRGLLGSYLGFTIGASLGPSIIPGTLVYGNDVANNFYKSLAGGLIGALIGGGLFAFAAPDIIKAAYLDDPATGEKLARAFDAADNMGIRGIPYQFAIAWSAFTHAPDVVFAKLRDLYYKAIGAYPGYDDLLVSIRQAVKAAAYNEGVVPAAYLDAVRAQAEDLALHGYDITPSDVYVVAESYYLEMIGDQQPQAFMIKAFNDIMKAAEEGYERGLALRLPDLTKINDLKALNEAFSNGLSNYLRQYYPAGVVNDAVEKIMQYIESGEIDEARSLLNNLLRPAGKEGKVAAAMISAVTVTHELPPDFEVDFINNYFDEYLSRRMALINGMKTVAQQRPAVASAFGFTGARNLDEAKNQLFAKISDAVSNLQLSDADRAIVMNVMDNIRSADTPGALELAIARSKLLLSRMDNIEAASLLATMINDWARAYRDLIYVPVGDASAFASRLREISDSVKDPNVKNVIGKYIDRISQGDLTAVQELRNELSGLVKAPGDDADLALMAISDDYWWYTYSMSRMYPVSQPTAPTTQPKETEATPQAQAAPTAQPQGPVVQVQLPSTTPTAATGAGRLTTIEDVIERIIRESTLPDGSIDVALLLINLSRNIGALGGSAASPIDVLRELSNILGIDLISRLQLPTEAYGSWEELGNYLTKVKPTPPITLKPGEENRIKDIIRDVLFRPIKVGEEWQPENWPARIPPITPPNLPEVVEKAPPTVIPTPTFQQPRYRLTPVPPLPMSPINPPYLAPTLVSTTEITPTTSAFIFPYPPYTIPVTTPYIYPSPPPTESIPTPSPPPGEEAGAPPPTPPPPYMPTGMLPFLYGTGAGGAGGVRRGYVREYIAI